jgi:3-oxoacyl-(acyl-carrier-protein) synthase
MMISLHTDDPIVITGIGLIASVGKDRESVWRAVRQGRSGVRPLTGLRGIPDNRILGAVVDLEETLPKELKVFALAEAAAAEAIADAHVNLDSANLERFACTVSSHMGDVTFVDHQLGLRDPADPQYAPWWQQWWPNTACWRLATKFGLMGPRMSYSTACASSLISIMAAVRAIRDDQCDIALTGGADAIDPLFAAGFEQMKVLAFDENPQRACRPFDRNRRGFVLGEGGAMFIIERLSHAERRGVKIYAEMRAIRRALGSAADQVCVSATKSMLGHMINAAGSVELAITALAMRDGFAPPTLNLTDPDPECTFDCLPLIGRRNRFQHALKLSVAFGGHLVAFALNRWNDPRTGFGYPVEAEAKVA